MKGLLKVVAGLVILVVVIIAAGGALIGAFFDPNEYKPEIESAALDKGIELKINGDIGWSVFPWLGLEINAIDIKLPGKAALGSLNQAQVSVRLPALLSGKVEMQSVVVDGLQLNLVQEQDGTNNWMVAAAPAKEPKNQAQKPQSNAKSSGLVLDIENIQITNGRITYKDKAANTQTAITELNIGSGQVVTDAFFPGELSFKLAQTLNGKEQLSALVKFSAEFFLSFEKQQYKIKGLASDLTLSGQPLGGNTVSFTTQADIAADLMAQSLEVNDLVLAAADLKASGHLQLTNFLTPQLSGKLDIAPFNLNKLLASVGQSKVVTQDPKALSAISAQIVLAGPANTITAKSLSLKLDETTFNGSAGLNLGNGNISLNLQGDKFNADSYMPPATEEPKTSEKAANKGYSKDPILPVDALKALQLDASFGLQQLHVANLDMSNIALQVNAHGGLIKANKVNLDLYGGKVRNKVTLDVRKKTPLITTHKKISGIQVGEVLQAVAETGVLTGAFNADSNLTLRGNSVYDFVNSVTGQANISMKDGHLHGIDMAHTVCQAMNNISSLGINSKEVDRSTPFAKLGATAKITNGLVQNNDLKAALDAMTLKGKGKVDLPQQLLDYRLGFTVEKNLFKESCAIPDTLEGVEIPVDCKGGFDTDPVKLCKPDLGFITDAIKQQAKAKIKDKTKAIEKKAKEKVEKKVEEQLKGKLNDKLKGLF